MFLFIMHLCTVLLLLHLFSYCILNWYSAIRLSSRKCEIKLSSVQFSSLLIRTHFSVNSISQSIYMPVQKWVAMAQRHLTTSGYQEVQSSTQKHTVAVVLQWRHSVLTYERRITVHAPVNIRASVQSTVARCKKRRHEWKGLLLERFRC